MTMNEMGARAKTAARALANAGALKESALLHAVDLSPVLLVLGVAALALAVFFLWKLLRGRRSDR